LKVLKIKVNGRKNIKEESLTNQDFKGILNKLVNDTTIGYKCFIKEQRVERERRMRSFNIGRVM
jgi:hypothetical protein